MADKLKDFYDRGVVGEIAGMLAAVHPLDVARFVDDVVDSGFDALSLTGRARRIRDVMRRHLPPDPEEAIEVLIASLGPPLDEPDGVGMRPFIYLPHVFFVAEYGLDSFETSMRAQHALTQRFTAEYSIRAFLVKHRDRTLERLREWTSDPSRHVRRLVSEGTRPRLPWAPRLVEFQRDPTPVLALLERLKDDPALYVRRSVANNLNDIGKDHPALLAQVAARWMVDAGPERAWVVRHALRSAIKRGEPGALAVLGAGVAPPVEIRSAAIAPEAPRIGERVRVDVALAHRDVEPRRLIVDLAIHFVKANGATAPKVFKLTSVVAAPGESVRAGKWIRLDDLSTRRHYPGRHAVELRVNGRGFPLGAFELRPAAGG